MPQIWIELTIYVVVGMLAGGLTNTVAVWMLFNPKERRLGFQGAVPKNQARLARSIGRTVGERLLTPADLQRELGRPELREAFDLRLTALVRSIILSRDPVIDRVPPAAVTALEGAMASYLPVAMEKLGGFLGQLDDPFAHLLGRSMGAALGLSPVRRGSPIPRASHRQARNE